MLNKINWYDLLNYRCKTVTRRSCKPTAIFLILRKGKSRLWINGVKMLTERLLDQVDQHIFKAGLVFNYWFMRANFLIDMRKHRFCRMFFGLPDLHGVKQNNGDDFCY